MSPVGHPETLVAYEAQLIMYCPQVVDDGPLHFVHLCCTMGSKYNQQNARGHWDRESLLGP